MLEWKPISLSQLYEQIRKTETHLNGTHQEFWKLIKIDPVKWQEKEYGDEGGGFWVVAIYGAHVIWYNDIEEGFNVSKFNTLGEITEYHCNQDELNVAVIRLFDLIQFGCDIIGQAGPPQNV